MKKLFYIFFLTITPYLAFSQINTELWTDYIHHSFVNPKLTYFGDITFRTGKNSSEVIGIRPSIKYTWKNMITLSGGIGVRFTFTTINVSESFEIRPWQGIQFKWPQTANFTLKHYFRVEEQYFTSSNFSEYKFDGSNTRLRYQIGTSIDIFRNLKDGFDISIPVEYEIFITNFDYFIGRDRMISGFKINMNNNWMTEFNIILQRNGTGFSNLIPGELIFRLRIIHNMFSIK